MADDMQDTAAPAAPRAAPPEGPRNRAIFITRDVGPYGQGRVVLDPDGSLTEAAGDCARPATRAEIEIGGLSLEIPKDQEI